MWKETVFLSACSVKNVMIDGVFMAFPCGYNVQRLSNYIFWDAGCPAGAASAEQGFALRANLEI